jgi:hypothetical protein
VFIFVSSKARTLELVLGYRLFAWAAFLNRHKLKAAAATRQKRAKVYKIVR